MKNRVLVIAAVLGTAISGYGLVITNDVVGPVNETAGHIYTLDSADGTSYYITNHTVTAEPGRDITLTTVTEAQNALGTSGLRSTGAPHEISLVNSSVKASNGGKITANTLASNLLKHNTDGGRGMIAANATIDALNATISGGNGGSIDALLANNNSSAYGGFAIQLLGTSVLNATNSTISGGNGGYINNVTRTGKADGGDGIYITGNVVVDLNLVNTTVTGGNGGTVTEQSSGQGTAKGGDALDISAGATVTINGGTYVGGSGGTVAGKAQADGGAISISGSTVTLAGGSFDGRILLAGGTSTLSLKNTFTDTAPFYQAGGTATFDEWYDGQLQDVTVAGGTMVFNSSNVFNLTGDFRVTGASAKASFNSGLVVKDGGMLSLGRGNSTAASALIEAGSTVMADLNGTSLGKITSSGDLTLENGVTWIINDVGTTAFDVGKTFTLASATFGSNITMNLATTDVQYQGANGSAGWLGAITNVSVVGASVQAVYGQENVNTILGVDGDTSSNYGQAMADLTTLAPKGSDAYDNLAKLTPSLGEAAALMTNGYIRTPEVARTLMGLPSVFSGQIRSRVYTHLNREQVGYPVASTPAGAGGWDALRDFSDRIESGFNTDRMRDYSDRRERAWGYENVKAGMDSLSPNVDTTKFGLPPEWQVWGGGYGSTAKQDERDGYAGFDATIGGGMLGIDKRVDNILYGLAGGYVRTVIDGEGGNDAQADTGNIAAYLATHGDRAFLDLNVNYAFNAVDTEMGSLGYTGNYNANMVSLFLGGGYAMPVNDWLVFTPDASIQAIYYAHDSYSEESSLGLPTKQYESYDQVTPLSSLGGSLSMIRRVEVVRYEMAFQPEVRAHWLHDFNADMDSETYKMVGGSFDIDTPLLATEEDLFQIGAGVRFAKWSSNTTEVGVDLDGTFGEDYNAYILSGRIIHRF